MYTITDNEFEQFRSIVLKLLGIKLADAKRMLIISRLSSRMKELKFQKFQEYITYLQDDANRAEITTFINKVTTNETSFFREERHFQYMTQYVLPRIQSEFENKQRKELRIWSSACSSGEEPYTIAITVLEYFKSPMRANTKILATDINTEVLEKASQGLYKSEELKTKMSAAMIAKYFDRYDATFVKVKPMLREMVTFRRLNLTAPRYPLKAPLDIIFCRNVMIYFDEATKKYAVGKFYDHLRDDGLLFIGHSENLFSITNQFKTLENTIYSKVL